VPAGDRVPLAEARAAVLKLRASKGMVLDDTDHDTWSAGSFFMNPVLSRAEFVALREKAGDGVPGHPAADDMVKSSAAWLIQHAGFGRGYARPGANVSLSTKHTLSLTNRGDGTTAEVLDLAREIQAGVQARFGVRLHPEVSLINCAL
jgi:UDP-N-acetylmuramate dehydrogenase